MLMSKLAAAFKAIIPTSFRQAWLSCQTFSMSPNVCIIAGGRVLLGQGQRDLWGRTPC